MLPGTWRHCLPSWSQLPMTLKWLAPCCLCHPSFLSFPDAVGEQLCFHAISWGSSRSLGILGQRDTLVCLQHSVCRICSLSRVFIMIFYFYCPPREPFVCINLSLRFRNLIMGSSVRREVINQTCCIPIYLHSRALTMLSIQHINSKDFSPQLKNFSSLWAARKSKKSHE